VITRSSLIGVGELTRADRTEWTARISNLNGFRWRLSLNPLHHHIPHFIAPRRSAWVTPTVDLYPLSPPERIRKRMRVR
jgi:hypothetical protein